MKELVFHRMFFPAIERFSSKVGFHDGVYHATFDTHADRVLRSARRHATRARSPARRSVRDHGVQRARVPRAVPRRLPRGRHRQPA